MITKIIPHMFTVGNLALGIIAILMAFHGEPLTASFLVILAMLADGLDGRIARALNVQSEFGKELDSLSDVISFGVAPAFVAFVTAFGEFGAAGWIAAVLFPVCGALRLARFNVKPATPGYFIGLPIPAAGGVLCTLALFVPDLDPVVLLVACVLLSFLMISNIHYPNFKRITLPKVYIWLTPIVIIIAVLVVAFIPGMTRFVLVPLVLYALWGLKKNLNTAIISRVRKHRRNARHEEQTIESDVS